MKFDDDNRLWKDGISFTSFSSQKVDYALSKLSKVESFSIADFFSLYKDILWDDGNHKYNVSSFLGELDEIMLGERFSVLDQDTVDGLIGKLRERGNCNHQSKDGGAQQIAAQGV